MPEPIPSCVFHLLAFGIVVIEAQQQDGRCTIYRPIEIGSDVWVGGAAIICPGVRVSSRSVIGAGSVE